MKLISTQRQKFDDGPPRSAQYLRRQKAALIFYLLCISSMKIAVSNAQTSNVGSDQRAVAIIQSSLSAMSPNSQSTATKISGVSAEGSLINYSQDRQEEWQFTYHDSIGVSEHGYNHNLSQNGHAHKIVSNQGRPIHRYPDARDEPIDNVTARYITADYMPYALLWESLQHGQNTVHYIERTSRDGKILDHLSVLTLHKAGSANSNRNQSALSRRDWYIDTASNLPLFSQSKLPTPNNSALNLIETVSYQSYKDCGGVLCPTEQIHSVGSIVTERLMINSVKIAREELPANTFSLEK